MTFCPPAVSGSSLRRLNNCFHLVEGCSKLAFRIDNGEEVIQQETPGATVVGIIMYHADATAKTDSRH